MGWVKFRIRGVLSLEEGTLRPFHKTLQRYLSINQCCHDLARSRRALFENADVPLEDVGPNHGVALNLQSEKTRRTGKIERRR